MRLEKFVAESQSWIQEALRFPEVRTLVRKLEQGEVLSLQGTSEAGKPFVMQLLAATMDRCMCVLASSVKQQEHLSSEMAALDCLGISKPEGRSSEIPRTVIHFPEIELASAVGSSQPGKICPDLETQAEVLQTLRQLQKGKRTHLIVTTQGAIHQRVPSPQLLEQQTQTLGRGDRVSIEEQVQRLLGSGYERETQVQGRGQFAQRGGILDIFPLQNESPIRIEFNGDEIESIRRFDLQTQASVSPLSEAEWVGLTGIPQEKNPSSLLDFLPESYLLWKEGADPESPAEIHLQTKQGQNLDSRNRSTVTLEIFGHDFLSNLPQDTVLQEQRQALFMRHCEDWLAEGYRLVVCCNNEGEEHRLRTLIGKNTNAIAWAQASLLRGFAWPSAKLVLLSDAEIFGRYQTLQLRRLERKSARANARRESIDFTQFVEGDFVVHVNHGIGRFLGIQKVQTAGQEQEVLTIEYQDGALLHVPIEQAHLVGRYVGVGKAVPTLDELGGSRWEKAAIRAQQATLDFAAELLKVEAHRKTHRGFSFAEDSPWQKEFEDSFLFNETPDQLTAIQDTKHDMESDKPMDRLICGDVGFGKTEVAIRAAFKAVMNGKQVAVLAPTTVLAQQHERTFRERMADYPVRIDLISRFRTKSQQRKTVAAVRDGAIDVLIGTHRLLQPDVSFKDLGLVVIDEEQRFGVKHKELFKQLFHGVDILTLSATPIPRTLYLSLVGAKDISTIETPPVNRLPIETAIAAYDERLIRSAIERELARGGQVFFLHNRIQSIQRIRDRIQELVPSARIEIGHGQMHEDDLEAVMMRFVAGEVDVLVSTTIIESGLDIPRANTIIIDRADRFGLADLYQLRGRVGRSQLKAYAYLLLPRHLLVDAQARKRVSAIQQYSRLGTGFKIAMRDLEIRGAGNILGTAQSGHATAIGFELYCQLLKESVARLKGEHLPPRVEVRIRLDFLPVSENHAQNGIGAFIPRSYMAESSQRIEAYRRLAEVREEAELQQLKNLWRDRFGKLPQPLSFLLELGRVRLVAAKRGISSVEVEENKLILQKGMHPILIGGRLPRLKGVPLPSSTSATQAKLTELLAMIQSLAVPPSGKPALFPKAKPPSSSS